MTHHSEPARAGADAYDNMVAWMSMNAPYHHMMTFKAALERSASPAPAAGGLEAGRLMRGTLEVIARYSSDSDARLRAGRVLANCAVLASPAATSAETQDDLVSRAEVIRVIRTLGDQDADLALYGAADNARAREYGEAAATRACCAIVLMPRAIASPAETQGGDGVREAVEDIGFVSAFLRIAAQRQDVPASVRRQIMKAVDIIAALAPSTSAATKGEPDLWMWMHPIYTGGEWNKCDPSSARNTEGASYRPFYANPAPAVESAQVKDLEDAIIACERGNTIYDVLANYRAVRRTIQDIRASLDLATDAEG